MALAVALAAAGVAFTATFRGPRRRFWQRMTYTGIGLGSWALLTSTPARRAGVRWWHLPLGLASAAILYVTFRFGEAVSVEAQDAIAPETYQSTSRLAETRVVPVEYVWLRGTIIT